LLLPETKDIAAMTTATFTTQVYIFDTDCYGIVWHGTYLKWLEMARWHLLLESGLGQNKAQNGEQNETSQEAARASQPWLFPVVEQHLQFKHPATLNDVLLITTQVAQKGPRLVFCQQVFKQPQNQLCLKAETTCVVTNPAQQLQRRVPQELLNALGLTP
jgi:acyl-CoA thioester hydrolase